MRDVQILLLVPFPLVVPAISISVSLIIDTFDAKVATNEELGNPLVPRLVHGVLHRGVWLPPSELPAHPVRQEDLDHVEEDKWHVCAP